jgi:molybdenum cofactor cytidylyltransferase
VVLKLAKSVCASDVDHVLVVLGHEAEKIRSALHDLPLSFIHNPGFREGMTSSIQSGVKALPEDCDGFIICLADMPFSETSELNHLIHTFQENRIEGKKMIVVPVFEGQRGNPVLFSSEFRKDILTHKGYGCRGIILNYPECVKEVIVQNDYILRDIDTLEDYEKETRPYSA